MSFLKKIFSSPKNPRRSSEELEKDRESARDAEKRIDYLKAELKVQERKGG